METGCRSPWFLQSSTSSSWCKLPFSFPTCSDLKSTLLTLVVNWVEIDKSTPCAVATTKQTLERDNEGLQPHACWCRMAKAWWHLLYNVFSYVWWNMFFFCVVKGSYIKVMGICIAHRCRIGTAYSKRAHTDKLTHTYRHKNTPRLQVHIWCHYINIELCFEVLMHNSCFLI